MKKIALLFTSEQVDAVTELLQGLEIVEIQDLKAQDSWIQAFSSQQVTSPQLSVLPIKKIQKNWWEMRFYDILKISNGI